MQASHARRRRGAGTLVVAASGRAAGTWVGSAWAPTHLGGQPLRGMNMAMAGALIVVAAASARHRGGRAGVDPCAAGTADFPACLASTRDQVQALEAAMQLARDAGVRTAEEQTTLAMGNFFIGAAEYDHSHNNTGYYAETLGWQCQGRCPPGLASKAAQLLPYKELKMASTLMGARTIELQSLANATTTRHPGRTVDWSSVGPCPDDSGWWCEVVSDQAHEPAFFGSWTWVPQGSSSGASVARELGTSIADVYLNVAALASRPGAPPNRQYLATVRATLDQLHASNTKAELFVGSNLPQWADAAYPGISNSSLFDQHDWGFDIDHPASRAILGPAYTAAAQELGDHPAVVSWMFANEPAFISTQSNWTQTKFRKWLRTEYDGDLAELNRLWNATFSSFATVPLRQYKSAMVDPICTLAEWHDWCAFNAWRVTDWFTFMHDTIVAGAPRSASAPPRCHAKIMNGDLWQVSSVPGMWQTHAIGIDREALIDLFEVNGCDTTIGQSEPTTLLRTWPPWPTNHPQNMTFAVNWLVLAMGYDFMRSLAPHKPLFDSEWHALSGMAGRYSDLNLPEAVLTPDYASFAAWHSHIHGQAGNIAWYRGRGSANNTFAVNPEASGSAFADQALTQPAAVEGYAYEQVRMNTHARAIRTVATAPRELCFLYSEAAAMANGMDTGPDSYLTTTMRVFEAANFLSVPLGFVTERQLQRGQQADCKLLLLPSVGYIENRTLTALAQLEARATGTVRLLGAGMAGAGMQLDPRGRPHDADALHFVSGLHPMVLVSGNETAQELHKRLDAALPFTDKPSAAIDTGASATDGAVVSRVLGCFQPGSTSLSAFGVECRAAIGPVDRPNGPGVPAGTRTMLLWAANFLKVTTAIEIRAQSGWTITRVTDVLSNASVPVVSAPDLTGDSGQVAVNLKTLQWRLLAVQCRVVAAPIKRTTATRAISVAQADVPHIETNVTLPRALE
eukprot:COSAG02_NODE_2044_length_10022_cov_81.942558_2_plen_966_part_00